MPLSESLNAQALRELGETKCPSCGGVKEKAKSFCLSCFRKLPPNMRQSLYRTFSDGYVGAFNDAKDFLRDL